MKIAHLTTMIAVSVVVSGCVSDGPNPEVLRASDVATSPPGADPNACYARYVTPAIIETVTQQVLVQPAQIDGSGSVSYPAIYRTETRQDIVRERHELWFQTLCVEEMTPEFIGSLQRALAVRGYHKGNISSRYDSATKRAVLAFQKEQGVDSNILSLAAARLLGLKEFPRDIP